MLSLERELLYLFNNGNKTQSLRVYREIMDLGLRDRHQFNFHNIRLLKNYLLTLNSAFYELTYKKQVCKKNLYFKRFKFMQKIEDGQTIKYLWSLGENMIEDYLEDLKVFCPNVNPIINNAIVYIDNNLDSELSLTTVASNINVSKNYLSLLFSNSLRINFSSFVNRRRIEKSKLLLETTDSSLLDIAMDCGFNSQSYFCSTFKNQVGMTATDYKKQRNKISV